jgi:hypothetical protein
VDFYAPWRAIVTEIRPNRPSSTRPARTLYADFVWQWPASFAVSNSERLVEAGVMQRADADRLQGDFRDSAHNLNAVMMTPLVLEIIAEKQ